MLKSYGWGGGVGWVGGWVAHEILVSAQGPLFLGFAAKGLGPGLDNYFAMKIIDVTFVKIATCNAINNLIFQVVIFMQSDKTVIIR